MGLSCLMRGHLYQKEGIRWISYDQDEYQSTNIGGMIKSYEAEIHRCIKCSKEKKIYTGKEKFI
jgi:hypothetical protein